jgi:integrase
MIVAETDIYAALPVLATYLGHDDISITERYLRLTADVFPEILQQVNLYCNNVIPEVIFYEAN